MTDSQGNDLPANPISELLEAMTHMNELFKSMIEAGFTEWQACRILGVYVAESGRQS